MKPESLRRPSTIRKTLYSFILSKKEGISGTWATNNPERQRVRSRTWKDCLELLKESIWWSRKNRTNHSCSIEMISRIGLLAKDKICVHTNGASKKVIVKE
jgi:hypothetical protein